MEAQALAVLAEEFEVRAAVALNEEDILVRLWPIAALKNAVRLTRSDDSGHARQLDNYPSPAEKSMKRFLFPFPLCCELVELATDRMGSSKEASPKTR